MAPRAENLVQEFDPAPLEGKRDVMAMKDKLRMDVLRRQIPEE
jgi:hypothetical protein